MNSIQRPKNTADVIRTGAWAIYTHEKMWFDFDEHSISSVPLLKLFYYPKVKARPLNSVHNFLRTTVPSNSIICAVCEKFLQCPLKKNI